MAQYCFYFIALLVVMVVILSKTKLLGSKDGQKLKLEEMTTMEYPMESSLLPIHHFSTFDKD